jgi:hypothetical protein
MPFGMTIDVQSRRIVGILAAAWLANPYSAHGQAFPMRCDRPYANLVRGQQAAYPTTDVQATFMQPRQPAAPRSPLFVAPYPPTTPPVVYESPVNQLGQSNAEPTIGPGITPLASPMAPPDGGDHWHAQVLPEGLIYRSYWAGIHEPRLGVQVINQSGGDSFWDPTVGARIGIFRYGDDDPLRPQGWQIDVEGAAMARLTLDYWRDLETVDFRGGVPLTYGADNWQFKLGYYHLSSHLGDEYAINHRGSLDQRVNYVRDAVMLGVSHYPTDFLRLYAELAYAVGATGGAEPWEIQCGAEVSRPGVTSAYGTPFFAMNVHLRQEHNFGGDVTAETGWLWRNRIGQVMRIGAFYFNGKSSQYQFYDDSQQQVGSGVWYDF